MNNIMTDAAPEHQRRMKERLPEEQEEEIRI